MNVSGTERKSRSKAVVSSNANMRLSGSRLIMARAVWLVLVAPNLVLFVVSLPVYYGRLQMACVDPVTCNLAGALTAKGLEALPALGFSVSGYAAFITIFLGIIIAIWSGIGLLIFWRRSDDWFALLAAFFLVMFVTAYQGGTAYALALAYPALNVPITLMSALGQVSIAAFFVLFPNGRLVPRWIGLILLLRIIQAVFSVFPLTSPFNANNWPGWLNASVAIVSYGAIIFSQVYRYRRESTPVQRQQTKNEVDLDQLREHLLAVVQETMQPSQVSLWLRKSEKDQNSNAWEANRFSSYHEPILPSINQQKESISCE